MTEWVAWLIGRKTLEGATPQVGFTAYGDKIAALRSVAIRSTIENVEQYKMTFPTAIPQKDKGWGEAEWFLWREDQTKKDPTLRAAGFGGSILSYRFPTALVWDDPHNPETVKTQYQRDETWRIYRTAVRTRVSQGITPIVGICTRFASDDLPGRVKSVEKDWVVLHTPALNENEETTWPAEVHKGVPMGFTTEVLLKMREEDRISFITQYQALPPSSEGDIFRAFTYRKKPVMEEVTKIVQFWDTATTLKTYSSYSAMVEFWVLRDKRVYINNVINFKKSPTDLIDVVVDTYWEAQRLCSNTIVAIEDAQAGSTFAAFLRSKSAIPIKLHRIPTGMSKRGNVRVADIVSRAAAVTKHWEVGDVSLPWAWEPWKEMFVEQLMAVPNGDHDDMAAAAIGGTELIYPHSYQGRPTAPFTLGRLVPR